MRKALYIVLSGLFLLTTGCEGSFNMESEMLKSEKICLKAGGKLIYEYNPATDQLGFNKSTCQFRAGSDNMGDYFTATCAERPSKKGQTIDVTLQWTENNTVVRKKRTMKVEKLSDNGYVWLWNRKEGIGAVVRFLE